MAQYGNYNNQSGYGQSNRYDQQAGNPYAQQHSSDHYGQQQQSGNPYDRQPVNTYPQGSNPASGYTGTQPSSGYGHQGNGSYGNNMEMGRINGNAANYGQQGKGESMSILQDCSDLDGEIGKLNGNLERIRALQRASLLSETDSSPSSQTNRQLDTLNADTMVVYRALTARVKKLKATPGAGSDQNAKQVGRVERRLKQAIQDFQKMDADYRNELQAQAVRQYQVVHGSISDEEARKAVADLDNNQVFTQALMQSDRRGQSQSALREVQGRHLAIQKIERQVVELAQLFEDMNVLVVQQEPVVERVNQQAEAVHENVDRANTELNGAVKKARAARRKKWYCLGIIVIILIILAIILGIVFGVVKK